MPEMPEGSWECVYCHVVYGAEEVKPELLKDCRHPVCDGCIPGAIANQHERCAMCNKRWEGKWTFLQASPPSTEMYVFEVFGGKYVSRTACAIQPQGHNSQWHLVESMTSQQRRFIRSMGQPKVRTFEALAKKLASYTGINISESEAVFLFLRDGAIVASDHVLVPSKGSIIYINLDVGRTRFMLSSNGELRCHTKRTATLAVTKAVVDIISAFPICKRPT